MRIRRRVDPVEQVLRAERDGRLAAGERGGDGLARPRLALRRRADRDPVGCERELHRGAALGHQRHPAHRLGERLRRQVGGAVELAGKTAAVPDELAGQQPGGQPPLPRLETDHRLGRAAPRLVVAAVRLAHHDPDLSAVDHHARRVAQRPGRHEERGLALVAETGRGPPGQLPDGQPVPVRRGERHHRAVEFQVDRGEHRQRVVTASGRRDLSDRVGEHAAVRGAREVRQQRQLRVVGQRHRRQQEGRVAAGHGDAIGVIAERNRVRGQGTDDLAEQPARHQDGAGLGHLGAEPDPRRHLVVEAGQGEKAAAAAIPGTVLRGVFEHRAEQQSREHRDHRPRGQRPGGPAHRIGERVPVDGEFHPAILACMADIPDRQCGEAEASTSANAAQPAPPFRRRPEQQPQGPNLSHRRTAGTAVQAAPRTATTRPQPQPTRRSRRHGSCGAANSNHKALASATVWEAARS